eukprot:gnl/Dysnectes_brevis/5166_a7309_346.p1 GENE.gnl/Dysnectes_brevis/5166_a7309_346~~gnl/Dysnectes_brevis/5166_a7309_346.p1  ORF type:complete len:1001 (-),score=104.53 gnl/Dysnectes_brevis/5166_a7309_346:34-3036(-)
MSGKPNPSPSADESRPDGVLVHVEDGRLFVSSSEDDSAKFSIYPVELSELTVNFRSKPKSPFFEIDRDGDLSINGIHINDDFIFNTLSSCFQPKKADTDSLLYCFNKWLAHGLAKLWTCGANPLSFVDGSDVDGSESPLNPSVLHGTDVFALPVPARCLFDIPDEDAFQKLFIPWPCRSSATPDLTKVFSVGRMPNLTEMRKIEPEIPTKDIDELEKIIGRMFRFKLPASVLSTAVRLYRQLTDISWLEGSVILLLSFSQISGSGKTHTFVELHTTYQNSNHPVRVLMFPLGGKDGVSRLGAWLKRKLAFSRPVEGNPWKDLVDELAGKMARSILAGKDLTDSLHDDPSFFARTDLARSPSEYLEKLTDIARPFSLVVLLDEALCLDHADRDRSQSVFGTSFVRIRQALINAAELVMSKNSMIKVIIAASDTHSAVSDFEEGSHSCALVGCECFIQYMKDVAPSVCSTQTRDSTFGIVRRSISDLTLLGEMEVFEAVSMNLVHSSVNKDELKAWFFRPFRAWFSCCPAQLLSGVPLWTTAFLTSVLKADDQVGCERIWNRALIDVIKLSFSKLHRDLRLSNLKFTNTRIKFECAITPEILRACVFSLLGHGLGPLHQTTAADLVRASCGCVIRDRSCKTEALLLSPEEVSSFRVFLAPGKLYQLAAMLVLNSHVFLGQPQPDHSSLLHAIFDLAMPISSYLRVGTTKGQPLELLGTALLAISFCTRKSSDISDYSLCQLHRDLASESNDFGRDIEFYLPFVDMGTLCERVKNLWSLMYYRSKAKSSYCKVIHTNQAYSRTFLCFSGVAPPFEFPSSLIKEGITDPFWSGGFYIFGHTSPGSDIILPKLTKTRMRKRGWFSPESLIVDVKGLRAISYSQVCKNCKMFICFTHPDQLRNPDSSEQKGRGINSAVFLSLYLPDWSEKLFSPADSTSFRQFSTVSMTVSKLNEIFMLRTSLMRKHLCLPKAVAPQKRPATEPRVAQARKRVSTRLRLRKGTGKE